MSLTWAAQVKCRGEVCPLPVESTLMRRLHLWFYPGFGCCKSRVVILSYGSDYNDLVRHASVGRERLNFSFDSFRGAINTLARTTGPNGTDLAKSLMLLIQPTSEAARFNDVYGIGADMMRSSSRNYDGLPMLQQRLENQWSAISEYAIRVSNNPSTPPLHVPQVGTFHSFHDVVRYMALLAGLPTSVPGGLSGDWKHTEL